jgi:hypothetical protein
LHLQDLAAQAGQNLVVIDEQDCFHSAPSLSHEESHTPGYLIGFVLEEKRCPLSRRISRPHGGLRRIAAAKCDERPANDEMAEPGG